MAHALRHLLGLLSDPHGDEGRVRDGIARLKAEGATAFVLLGDVEQATAMDPLAGEEAWVVFGNCDDEQVLGRYAEGLGLRVAHPLGRIENFGKSVAFTHGHLDDCVAAAFAEGPDYLLHGHTHRKRDDRIGQTRVINPGALARTGRASVAILDTFADEVRFLPLP